MASTNNPNAIHQSDESPKLSLKERFINRRTSLALVGSLALTGCAAEATPSETVTVTAEPTTTADRVVSTPTPEITAAPEAELNEQDAIAKEFIEDLYESGVYGKPTMEYVETKAWKEMTEKVLTASEEGDTVTAEIYGEMLLNHAPRVVFDEDGNELPPLVTDQDVFNGEGGETAEEKAVKHIRATHLRTDVSVEERNELMKTNETAYNKLLVEDSQKIVDALNINIFARPNTWQGIDPIFNMPDFYNPLHLRDTVKAVGDISYGEMVDETNRTAEFFNLINRLNSGYADKDNTELKIVDQGDAILPEIEGHNLQLVLEFESDNSGLEEKQLGLTLVPTYSSLGDGSESIITVEETDYIVDTQYIFKHEQNGTSSPYLTKE